jgi:hypothetical protein
LWPIGKKNKPIAWSEKGSYALSTLRAEALNLAKAASRTLNITATNSGSFRSNKRKIR